ncbi:hypothetical protein PVAP13_1NG052408 [Panicum virgatum]|uniref:Uncharacterized protein n=1 Tax=Panicum virgatum TaxID=38727 RepID=A0A8T0WTL3_PANVG|nr:hypothetical protein PVAP13_1NG052408 [Panicum virgatum]
MCIHESCAGHPQTFTSPAHHPHHLTLVVADGCCAECSSSAGRAWYYRCTTCNVDFHRRLQQWRSSSICIVFWEPVSNFLPPNELCRSRSETLDAFAWQAHPNKALPSLWRPRRRAPPSASKLRFRHRRARASRATQRQAPAAWPR